MNFPPITVHVYLHDPTVEHKLDLVLAALTNIAQQEKHLMKEMDELTANVAENTTVAGSVAQALANLAAEIARLKNDPVALQALSDQIKKNSQTVIDAIVANTPAE